MIWSSTIDYSIIWQWNKTFDVDFVYEYVEYGEYV